MMKLERHADIISTHVLMDQPFDDGLGDLTLEQAFDLQDMVAERLRAPLGGVAGYKIAWNSPALMEKMAMPHPGMGRVFNAQLHDSGVQLSLGDYRDFMIEAEIVAHLGADLEPGQTHDAASVAAAIDGFTCGFELLDRRGAPGHATSPAIIGHNVFNAGAILGDATVAAEDLDMGEITTRVQVGQEMLVEDVNLAPQDPFEAVAFLANHFCGRGKVMAAGQVILCGSHIPLHAIDTPTYVAVSMGPLGAAEFEIS